RGSFREVSGASKITQQDIQNLCKPFPCSAADVPTASPAAVAAPPRVQQYPITATDFRPAAGRIMPDEISRASSGTAEEKELLRNLSNKFLDAFDKEARKNNMQIHWRSLLA